MRYQKVDINDIEYTYTDYNQSLYDSVLRIGFSFPIHVIKHSQKFKCVDGCKRLSILHDILKADPHYKRGSRVYVLIKDGTHDRSGDCWRGRNSH